MEKYQKVGQLKIYDIFDVDLANGKRNWEISSNFHGLSMSYERGNAYLLIN